MASTEPTGDPWIQDRLASVELIDLSRNKARTLHDVIIGYLDDPVKNPRYNPVLKKQLPYVICLWDCGSFEDLDPNLVHVCLSRIPFKLEMATPPPEAEIKQARTYFLSASRLVSWVGWGSIDGGICGYIVAVLRKGIRLWDEEPLPFVYNNYTVRYIENVYRPAVETKMESVTIGDDIGPEDKGKGSLFEVDDTTSIK